MKLATKLIQNTFSIKDLENLSEIKAHTIRVWEQRYSALEPERSEGNQRIYSTESLKRLLNLAYLTESGYKISKIASLPKSQLESLVNEKIIGDKSHLYFNDQLKLAILTFDEEGVDKIIDKVIERLGLELAYTEVIFPILKKVGILWQSSKITPAHEHFVANVIKQKLILSTAQIPKNYKKEGPVFVLFLPDHELHEIGLLYVNLYLRIRGAKTVYLGQSTPTDNLSLFNELQEVIYVSSFTVYPKIQDYNSYLKDVYHELKSANNPKFWFHCRDEKDVKLDYENMAQFQTQEKLKELVDSVL